MNSASDPLIWASSVSRRHYMKRRNELDALILAINPGYQRDITAELDRFTSSAASVVATYDAKHACPAYARPRFPRMQVALAYTFVFASIIGFGIMLPIGGRNSGADFPDSSWQYLIVVSFALFALAVLTQLVRALPIRLGVPPRKDLAWLPLILGAPALVVMYLRVRQGIGVDPLWANLTAAVLAVSLLYCLTRLVRRRRDPELTRRVDSADKKRITALRTQILALGTLHAERMIEIFDALTGPEREELQHAFDEGAAVLRSRGLIGPVMPRDRKRNTKNSHGRLTPVPGFLLLAPAIRQAWNPDIMIYDRRMRITWRVSGWELQFRSRGASSGSTALVRSPRWTSRRSNR